MRVYVPATPNGLHPSVVPAILRQSSPARMTVVPMLAIAKIICDRVRPLAAFGHFLAG